MIFKEIQFTAFEGHKIYHFSWRNVLGANNAKLTASFLSQYDTIDTFALMPAHSDVTLMLQFVFSPTNVTINLHNLFNAVGLHQWRGNPFLYRQTHAL